MNKPYQSYNGGKEGDGTYQKIINHIPVHDIYIELFLGNGAIFRHKKQAQYSIGIDKDASVIEKWQQISSAGINLINTDAISWLDNFSVLAGILKKQGTRVFIYIDPPYLKETRKNSKDLYKHEMDKLDHIKLLTVAGSVQADIMFSHYPCHLYDSFLKGWNTYKFTCQTRNGSATEKLYYNYDKPSQLHDYRYLGENFRERERIKGIVHRNTSKIKRMPAAERNALINNLKMEGIL